MHQQSEYIRKNYSNTSEIIGSSKLTIGRDKKYDKPVIVGVIRSIIADGVG